MKMGRKCDPCCCERCCYTKTRTIEQSMDESMLFHKLVGDVFSGTFACKKIYLMVNNRISLRVTVTTVRFRFFLISKMVTDTN